jgi:peroxiredoxin
VVQAELTRRGGRVLAVSSDDTLEAARLRRDLDLPFHVASDPGARAAAAFGLLHEHGGPGGKDVALPAQVLLDRDLKILWRHVARRIQDRPSPDEVLAAIREHLGI